MPIYQAPLRDYQFILSELLNVYKQTDLRGFDEIDADLTDAILQGVADFSTDIMLPLNASGDKISKVVNWLMVRSLPLLGSSKLINNTYKMVGQH
tara:strand:+ start:33344 stop:33628 length:285 start_codon:yes stop_codon:yes gene_type:complete